MRRTSSSSAARRIASSCSSRALASASRRSFSTRAASFRRSCSSFHLATTCTWSSRRLAMTRSVNVATEALILPKRVFSARSCARDSRAWMRSVSMCSACAVLSLSCASSHAFLSSTRSSSRRARSMWSWRRPMASSRSSNDRRSSIMSSRCSAISSWRDLVTSLSTDVSAPFFFVIFILCRCSTIFSASARVWAASSSSLAAAAFSCARREASRARRSFSSAASSAALSWRTRRFSASSSVITRSASSLRLSMTSRRASTLACSSSTVAANESKSFARTSALAFAISLAWRRSATASSAEPNVASVSRTSTDIAALACAARCRIWPSFSSMRRVIRSRLAAQRMRSVIWGQLSTQMAWVTRSMVIVRYTRSIC
mmetsp:Transcript_26530/g.67435  ORF Transcript_26530/g.67435 Transcript_26530/m.67435 type:complete len:374 (-) Transcript_26530:28-1149(-)